jgi:glutamine cyclotransferase
MVERSMTDSRGRPRPGTAGTSFRSRRRALLGSACIFIFLPAIAWVWARSAGKGFSREGWSGKVKLYKYQVLDKYPHDRGAFTQGLIYYDDYLYESTGLQGKSSLRKIELKTGRLLKKVDLDEEYFGEGLTIFGGKIYQLTWLTGIGFIYDLDHFDKVGEFHYDGQGWGLTHDGRSLILSDGTNRLRFMDPREFKLQRSIEVFEDNLPLTQLNELEFIKGEIFSNIWHKDVIARIDPATGQLTGMIDLSGLGLGLGLGSEDVLNGIAYLEKEDCLLVTGKRWPFLFKIRITVAGE